MLAIPSRSELRLRPLLTPRLALTPLEAADARDAFAAIQPSRKSLEPWLPWVPFTSDEDSTLRYADASASDWDSGRATRLAIRERERPAGGIGRFLGVVGLENLVALHRRGDLGYWLRDDVVGQGLMTEACAGVLEFAFERMRVHRIHVAAATDNHRSLAVIRRLGFRMEGIARQAENCGGRWLDHVQFGLLTSDPRPRPRYQPRS